MIRSIRLTDASDITAIYNHYILTSPATFEEQPIDEKTMQQRISNVIVEYPWFVYELDERVVGYAYATRWRERSAYRYSCESTVYVDHNHTGNNIGKQLYIKLINRLRDMGMHAILGGITLPNQASISLHEGLGYKKIAHLREVGFKFGKWWDVGYWQLINSENGNGKAGDNRHD